MRRAAIFLLCLIVFTACAPAAGGPTAAPPAPQGVQGDGRRLRIVFPMATLADQTPYLRYAEQLLAQEGIELTLEVYKGGTQDYAAEYAAFARGALEQDAVVFAAEETAKALIGEGAARDVYQEALSLAPGYLRRCALLSGSEERLSMLPVSMQAPPLLRPAVLIKEDVYSAYGGAVRTAEEYKALLQRIRQAHPQSVPGAAAPFVNDTRRRNTPGYTAMSLFMPQWGYVSADEFMYRLRAPFCGLFYSTATRGFVDAASLRECTDAYGEWIAWNKEGLMDFWNGGTLRQKPSFRLEEYPTLLMNLAEVMAGFSQWETYYPAIRDIDWTGYRVSILYPDALPKVDTGEPFTVGMYALVGKGADSAGFLRFLEWLESPDAYSLVVYGKEGVDFERTPQGAVSALAHGITYWDWQQRSCFLRGDMEHAAAANRPLNLDEEVRAITYPIALRADLSAMKEGWERYGLADPAEKVSAAYAALHQALYGGVVVPEAAAARERADALRQRDGQSGDGQRLLDFLAEQVSVP